MFLKYFGLGVFVKLVTGFDDTLTHVPIIASVTKTKLGKIAFSIGTLIAIICAIAISMSLTSFLKIFPYYRYIIAVLLFALAAAMYFDVFIHKPRTEAEKSLFKLKKRISTKRFTKLIGIGFLASFATVLDDIVAFSPLFLGTFLAKGYAIAGIFLMTLIEIILAIYFAEKISKLKYKEELATIGLIILGILILTKII